MSTPAFSNTTDVMPQLKCSICLESLRKPVCCMPCEHTFCRHCITSLLASSKTGQKQCPDCRGSIKAFALPHAIIQRMANALEVECDDCGAVMPCEDSYAHHCPVIVSRSRQHDQQGPTEAPATAKVAPRAAAQTAEAARAVPAEVAAH